MVCVDLIMCLEMVDAVKQTLNEFLHDDAKLSELIEETWVRHTLLIVFH